MNNKKISFADSSIIDNINNTIEHSKNVIMNNINTTQKIDISQIQSYHDTIIKKINTYNQIIDLWYDEQFYQDYNNYIHSIMNNDIKYQEFCSSDYISFTNYHFDD